MLMESLPAALKDDRRFPYRTESCRKFTEGLHAQRRVDRRLRKVSRPHPKLTKVDGRSAGCMESTQKLMEGFANAGKIGGN